jgi:LysM repeat protein
MPAPLTRTTVLCLIMALLAAGLGALPAAAAPAADGPNLLVDPGFEGPFGKQCCQTDMSKYPPGLPIDEVQVASGWLGWWVENPSAPFFHRPEWREANCGAPCANRVHSGANAQKYFTFFSTHEAGMFQRVSGVQRGQRVRFSVWMEGWSTNENYGSSSGQASMGMRVGIDPTGGTNAFSANIVWSPVMESYDTWSLYSVEAVASSSAVTVFTRSHPDYPLQHNDIYVDDASLVVVGTGIPSSPSTSPTQPPAAAATPTAASGFVYIVQSGDNFYRIARRFGVSVDAIYAANHIANPSILAVGTRLVIPGVAGPEGGSTGAGSAAPTPAPTVSAAQLPGATSYVVQPGDNLWRLSVRFGVSIARIKQLNNLTSDIIYIGQVLVIAP